MYFKFVGQCFVMATTLLPKPCGCNFFHSFHVIQIKPGIQGNTLPMITMFNCKMLLDGTTSTVLMQLKVVKCDDPEL